MEVKNLNSTFKGTISDSLITCSKFQKMINKQEVPFEMNEKPNV